VSRDFASVDVSIWRDESFTSLSVGAQWLHMLLRSQGELTPASTLPTRPRRWAGIAAGASAAEITGLLRELQSAGWAYTDDDYQETFVSGVFASELVAAQPRRVVGALDAIAEVKPESLRATASVELGALITHATDPPAPRGARLAVLERDGFKCRQCGWKPGDPVPAKKGTTRAVYRTLEIDHVWPKSRGGADHESNYQVLCSSCNARKGARV